MPWRIPKLVPVETSWAWITLQPQGWAPVPEKQPGEMASSADRHSIVSMGRCDTGLLQWCWHSNIDDLNSFGCRKSSGPWGPYSPQHTLKFEPHVFSCIFDYHMLPQGCCPWSTRPEIAGVIDPVHPPLSSPAPHPPAGSAIHVIQASGVAPLISSNGFLHCCSAAPVGPSIYFLSCLQLLWWFCALPDLAESSEGQGFLSWIESLFLLYLQIPPSTLLTGDGG